MVQFHVRFLEIMGTMWQEEEVATWKIKHLVIKKDYQSFITRIRVINEEAASKGKSPRMDMKEIDGSIGAYDATYSLRPRILPETLSVHGEDSSSDRMYS
jgi:hypothetical protein